MRHRNNCSAVRSVQTEVVGLLCKPLRCLGPIYLRDHCSPCAMPPQPQVAISQRDSFLQRRLCVHQELSRSMQLSLPDLCQILTLCKSCISYKVLKGGYRNYVGAFVMFLPSLSSVWCTLFSSLRYLSCWQVRIYFNGMLQGGFCKSNYWKGTWKC